MNPKFFLKDYYDGKVYLDIGMSLEEHITPFVP